MYAVGDVVISSGKYKVRFDYEGKSITYFIGNPTHGGYPDAVFVKFDPQDQFAYVIDPAKIKNIEME